MLLNIWRYRQFIMSCVKREFQARYKGSVLGALWAVFQPLAMIFVYTVVFSEVMKSKLQGMETMQFAYSIYLCAGVLTWNCFQETLMGCVNVFLSNAALMKKVAFPRICLPVISVCSSFMNSVFGFLLFFLFLLVIGKLPWGLLPCVFLAFLVQTMFSLTLGIGLGVLNVFFRDIGQMLGVLLQFWFWFTPVVYPVTVLPEQIRGLLVLNPMYPVIHAYQEVFVYQRVPDFLALGGTLLVSCLLGAWALHMYHKHVGEMVDEL